MGWCSGTDVFDKMVEELIKETPIDKKKIIKTLIETLEDMDWDCQADSVYIEHPLVKEVMLEHDPDWKDWYDA